MADFNLLDITPHQVSRDLRGYSVFFYGEAKSGKTTIATKFPNHLLLAFEKGYNAIPGVMAQPITSWGEFRKALRQLRDEKVKERFETIIVDTADIAYDYCERYICSNANVDTIGDIPYGKGYKLAAKEFDECLRSILQMNYGLVIISHDQDKTFTDEQGKEYNKIIPTLENKARLVCERTCDIIGYSRIVETEDGAKTKLFLRETPRFMAGSRFKYIAPSIDFNYNELVKAIADAVDAEANEHGSAAVVAEAVNLHTADKIYNFDEMMKEFQTVVGDLVNSGTQPAKITDIVERHLGKGKKVTECTEAHAEQLDLILYDLKQL